MGELRIGNARLEERVANTERRDQVTRLEGELACLAQRKGEATGASAPKSRSAPKQPL
jgi:hypothetical protein